MFIFDFLVILCANSQTYLWDGALTKGCVYKYVTVQNQTIGLFILGEFIHSRRKWINYLNMSKHMHSHSPMQLKNIKQIHLHMYESKHSQTISCVISQVLSLRHYLSGIVISSNISPKQNLHKPISQALSLKHYHSSTISQAMLHPHITSGSNFFYQF